MDVCFVGIDVSSKTFNVCIQRDQKLMGVALLKREKKQENKEGQENKNRPLVVDLDFEK